MKTLLAAVITLLSFSSMVMAEKPKPNPADYTVGVEVVFSRYIIVDSPIIGYQQMETVIAGQQVELRSGSGTVGVLALGEYKAKLITTYKEGDGYIPTKPNGFDQCSVYQLLLPDGSTRDYYVVGLGRKEPYPATPATAPNP